MLTLERSKTLKALVVILTLLIASFAQVVWAKEGRGKGEQRGNAEQRQQIDRTTAHSGTPSSSRPAEAAGRESPGGNSRPSGPSMSEQIQRTPQVSQRQTPSSRGQQPDISGPQVRQKPTSGLQFGFPARQFNDAKPSHEAGQTQRDFRITKMPSGVEVRRPATANPTKIPSVKPKPERDERIVTRIESPRPDSKPTRERGRDENRISPIGVPREKPTPTQKPETSVTNRPQRDEQSRTGDGQAGTSRGNTRDFARGNELRDRTVDRANDFRISRDQRWFGRSRQDGLPKPGRDATDRSSDFIRSRRRTVQIGDSDHEFRRFRPTTTTRVIYEDRNSIFGARHHHDFIFRDQHHRICNRIIWPRYYFPVYYRWGRHYSFHHVYPFYHRRYIFVSMGGFWPEYTCVRYYWYPTHYYMWYGYTPVAYEVPGDTYNYYTYNYYGQQSTVTTATDYSTSGTGLTPVNAETFADVREKLSRQQQGPDAQTLADTLFDDGVKAFEQGSYADAAQKFAAAMELAPEDMILPFAYAQALFADGRFTDAANAIRSALLKSSPDKEGVYYPRGLYLDENTLDEQIDQLAKTADALPSDSDLQLLLGYQWLGVGETEKSIGPLTKAKEDYKNSQAATTLLNLAEKIKAGETQ